MLPLHAMLDSLQQVHHLRVSLYICVPCIGNDHVMSLSMQRSSVA